MSFCKKTCRFVKKTCSFVKNVLFCKKTCHFVKNLSFIKKNAISHRFVRTCCFVLFCKKRVDLCCFVKDVSFRKKRVVSCWFVKNLSFRVISLKTCCFVKNVSFRKKRFVLRISRSPNDHWKQVRALILETVADREKRTAIWDHPPYYRIYSEQSISRSPDDLWPWKQEVGAYLGNRPW